MLDEDEVIYPWVETAREKAFRCRIFDVEKVRREEATSEASPREGEFYVLQAPDWVNVVALTDVGDVVLIEQWRHGVQRPTLEIPGGMVDPGEDPMEAARRELQEETGYVAQSWSPLGVIDPNPAIQSNRCFTFLAEGARRVEAPRFDGHERCRLVLASAGDLGALVASGRITHALVVVALHFARLRQDGYALPPPTPPRGPDKPLP